jgi:hypothetical protein
MDQVRRTPRLLLAMIVSIHVATAACSGASSPTGSAGPSAAPSAGGPVTSEQDALARVVQQEPRFAGITKRDPNLIGQANWYEIAPASGAYLVTIRIGWGDCPSGCIDEHTWMYAVAPDGSVTLQSQGGTDVPPDAWPAPGGEGQVGATGLHFTAFAGPTCPVEQPGDPACAPKPVPNVPIVIMDGTGKVLDKLVLNASGAGVVTLDPGDYIIRTEGVQGYMSGPQAQQVTVVAGRVTQVDLRFDTGIR